MAYRKNRRPAKNAHRRIVFPDIFWRVELFTRRATQPLRRLLFSNFGLLTELGHGTFRQFKSLLFPLSRVCGEIANSPAIFKTIGGVALLLFTTTGKT